MSHNRIAGKLDSTGGFLIERVAAGSWAEQAGLRPGQIIVRINGAPVAHAPLYEALLAGILPGPVRLRVRNGNNGEEPDKKVAPCESFFQRFVRSLLRAFSVGVG
jgi:S1-C subfamily serine protease